MGTLRVKNPFAMAISMLGSSERKMVRPHRPRQVKQKVIPKPPVKTIPPTNDWPKALFIIYFRGPFAKIRVSVREKGMCHVLSCNMHIACKSSLSPSYRRPDSRTAVSLSRHVCFLTCHLNSFTGNNEQPSYTDVVEGEVCGGGLGGPS